MTFLQLFPTFYILTWGIILYSSCCIDAYSYIHFQMEAPSKLAYLEEFLRDSISIFGIFTSFQSVFVLFLWKESARSFSSFKLSNILSHIIIWYKLLILYTL